MGNRHPHNPESCDSLVPELSTVNSQHPVESESAHVTPLHRPIAPEPSCISGRLNKSVSDSNFPSSSLASVTMSASITSNVNVGAGPSSSNGVQRPPLKFSIIHGENVRLTNNQRTASRTDSFCKALAFSDRPIAIDEMVCLRFAEVKTSWSGMLRFGVTNMDPTSFGDNLPKYVCPDMTSKEGTWAKAVSDRYCQQSHIMHFFVRDNGEMYYGINGNLKGLFLSGINTRAPLFVVVDIYGNTTSVEFVDESEVPPLRRLQPRPRPAVPPPPTIPPPAIPTDVPIDQPTVSDAPPIAETPAPVAAGSSPGSTTAVTGTPTGPPMAIITPSPAAPVTAQGPNPSPRPQPQASEQRPAATSVQQQLTRELEQRLNFAQQRSSNTIAPSTATASTSNATAGPSRRMTDAAPAAVGTYKGLPLTPLQFHATHGRTVSFNGDRTVATRLQTEYSGGYVFTARPVRCNEKVIIQVVGVENQYSGGLGFGVTNCDPGQLTNFEFPDDADELLNRPEFWAVNKDYERVPTAADEMTYFINEKGEVVYQKNRESPRILMHVDPSLTYYMLFDVYGRAQCIRCIGTTDARNRTASPAPPTIPQHRRRQHQNGNPQMNRRTISTPAAPNGFNSASSTTSQPPVDVLRQLQSYQQRPSGLTVNLPPPDVPRRNEGNRWSNAAQFENAGQQAGPSSAASTSSSSSRGGPSRHYEHIHGRHGSGQPPPRPSRPPPPAPPQRTNSVPTAQAMSSAQSSTTMPRPASTSTVESRDNSAAASASASSASTSASLAISRECTICMDQAINSAVYPCGHMCMCYECGRTTWQRQGVCPICRQEIKDILRIFPQ